MKFTRPIAIAVALMALAIPMIAPAQVVGPSTFTFNAASQSNVWSCPNGQSSFALTVPSGLTGTFTVTVAQTTGGTYVNPPWSYAPGVAAYANAITNSGSLTVTLGSNQYVKVADTAYTSGSATVTGVCSGAVAFIPPQASPTPLPSAPALAGTNFTGLVPSSFASGSFTAGTCVKVNNSSTSTIQSAPARCVLENQANTFTADQTVNGNFNIQANGVAGALDHGLKFQNSASSVTVPAAIDAVNAYAASINSACSSGQPVTQEWNGVSGATATNYGGYTVFWNKYDGSCSGAETLVLTANAHIYPAGPAIGAGSTSGCIGNDNQGICQITTAASCTALVACGTVTVNFGKGFYNTDGVTTQMPYCFYTIQDTNLATNAWVPVPETIAYNEIIVGYAPLVAQATPRTLNIMYRCNASNY